MARHAFEALIETLYCQMIVREDVIQSYPNWFASNPLRICGGVGFVAAVFAVLWMAYRGLAIAQSEGPDRTYFRISTGSVSGTYFPIGEALAAILSQPLGVERCEPGDRCGAAGVSAAAVASEGSVANVQRVGTGLVESALAQGDVVAWGYEGREMFASAGALTKLRAIASLYPEGMHLVAARRSAVRRIGDLRGKSVSVDRPRSGTNVDARMVLDAFGLRTGDLELREIGTEVAAEQLAAGDLDAFFFLGGWPIPLISDLADRGLIDLVPLVGAPVRPMLETNPALVTMLIPAGTYPGIGDVETLGVDALWVTSADLPDALIYSLTKALWSEVNRKTLDHAHPMARFISSEAALEGIPIPLHEGARRYYDEKGLTVRAPHVVEMTENGVPIPRRRPAIEPSPAAIQ